MLKAEPPFGKVSEGEHVLVDYGTCPKGDIKEIVGGNIVKEIARKSYCIPRKQTGINAILDRRRRPC